MIQKFIKDFRSSVYAKSIPIVTPAVIISSLSAYLLARPEERGDGSLGAFKSRLIDRVRAIILQNDPMPAIPAQDKNKPTILFDFQNLLTCNRFSLRRFDFMTYKRAYCEAFLYNLIGNYEIINISDMHAAEGTFLMNEIDPYGCIAYRLFTRDKARYTIERLNRSPSRLVVLSTAWNEFHKSLNENTIRLPKWRGEDDAKLFDIMHFFNNLHFLKLDDYRPTLKSYDGKDFFSAFRNVQKRLYNQRNLFSRTPFESRLQDVNERKVREYQLASANMEKYRKKEGWVSYSRLVHFVKNILL